MKESIERVARRRGEGFSLLEVVIALFILSVGVFSFYQLQGQLARSGFDARVRSLASVIAEDHMESQRKFTQLASDPQGELFAFDDIDDDTFAVTRGGIVFTVDQTVDEYYWDSDSGQFSETAPAGQQHADFKRVRLRVTWANPLQFQIDDNQQTSDHLKSGGVSVSSIIPSTISATRGFALIDRLDSELVRPPLSNIISMVDD